MSAERPRSEVGGRRSGAGSRALVGLSLAMAGLSRTNAFAPHASKSPTSPGQTLRRAGTSAFTLIEIIVALAIFAVAATVLVAAYVNVLNAMERVKGDQSLEQEIAFVRMQVLLEPDRDTVEEGGEVPTANSGEAIWRATVTPSEEIADLFRVDLEIQLPGIDDRSTNTAAREHQVTQTLWVLRPEWSEPTERDELRAKSRERLQEIKRGRAL